MANRTSSFKRQDSKELARSLSCKEWDAIGEPSSSSSSFSVVPLRKKGHIESITKPTILPEQPFVFFSPKPKPEVDKADKPFVFDSPKPKTELDEAATKVQKVYRSYMTRRNLADCADLVEELWWKTLEYAALNRNGDANETNGSINFTNDERTLLSRR